MYKKKIKRQKRLLRGTKDNQTYLNTSNEPGHEGKYYKNNVYPFDGEYPDCGRIRHPSLKRSDRVWKRFHKLFPAVSLSEKEQERLNKALKYVDR